MPLRILSQFLLIKSNYMQQVFNRFFLLLMAVSVYSAAIAQPGGPRGDTSRRSPGPTTGPRPYKEIITDKAITRRGMFVVHKVDDKYYFELPAKLLGRDILVVNRVSKSSVESPKAFFGYAGDQVGQNVIRFERGPNNKIFLKNISYRVNPSDSSKPMYRSVLNSNIQPIVFAYDIKSNVPDSIGSGVVIDVTDNITADNEIFGFAGFAKSQFQAGSFQSDKS